MGFSRGVMAKNTYCIDFAGPLENYIFLVIVVSQPPAGVLRVPVLSKERFLQTLKNALKTSQGKGSLNQRLYEVCSYKTIETYPCFQYVFRNTPHTVKGFPAAALLKRLLWRRLDLLKPTGTKQVILSQQRMQVES